MNPVGLMTVTKSLSAEELNSLSIEAVCAFFHFNPELVLEVDGIDVVEVR